MPEHIKPSGFILLRVTGALVLYSISYFILVKERIDKSDLVRFFLCGIFGIAINQLLFFEGLSLTTPINASIVMTANPILVLVLSYFILKEKIKVRKAFGIGLGIIGSILLITQGSTLDFSSNYQFGNLLVFINAASYGVYLILVQPLMRKYHPLTVMLYVFSFGFPFVGIFGFEHLIQVNWVNLNFNHYMSIVFVVFGTTFIAYLCNSVALQKLQATTVSIYIYLQPLLASIFAIIIGSDTLDFIKITAAFLIFIGVYLVSSNKNNKKT
tara:strand:- start:167 stop:976 length:810 start_codon:yes stop_codon:yes gene_type:complete